MDKRDNDGPAFPEGAEVYSGMTLRDYFAAKAMQGMVTRGEDDGQYVAESAYRYADAMLKRRAK